MVSRLFSLLLAAPLALTSTPVHAMEAETLTSVITQDSRKDQKVFAFKEPRTIVSSVDIYRSSYEILSVEDVPTFKAVVEVKKILPRNSVYNQNFSVAALSRDGTEGFIFYRSSKGLTDLYPGGDNDESCSLAKTSLQRKALPRPTVTFTVPVSCIAEDQELLLNSDASVSQTTKRERKISEDYSPLTTPVFIR